MLKEEIGSPVGKDSGMLTGTGYTDKEDQRKIAKLQGYEGDACGECGSFTLVRNGTCLKCNNCGSTTGCS